MKKQQKILVTGGAGYVGAVLVPTLLEKGYQVHLLELFIYGESAIEHIRSHPNLTVFKGDIRDQALVKDAVKGCDTVIHLACISNDPSFELNPSLGKSINLDAFDPLVQLSIDAGVKRFIYASSSSVYGIKETPQVDETQTLAPLTEYSKYKAQCESIVLNYSCGSFCPVIVRPATVCGVSPRQRLDVIVNILTNHAVNTGEIKVFGGPQKRPNIHIQDMVDFYCHLLVMPKEKISGEIYNIGCSNETVDELAQLVAQEIGDDIIISKTPTNDNRSYHISSEKIKTQLAFTPQYSVQNAIQDLKAAFEKGAFPDAMTDDNYYNVRKMKDISIS